MMPEEEGPPPLSLSNKQSLRRPRKKFFPSLPTRSINCLRNVQTTDPALVIFCMHKPSSSSFLFHDDEGSASEDEDEPASVKAVASTAETAKDKNCTSTKYITIFYFVVAGERKREREITAASTSTSSSSSSSLHSAVDVLVLPLHRTADRTFPSSPSSESVVVSSPPNEGTPPSGRLRVFIVSGTVPSFIFMPLLSL